MSPEERQLLQGVFDRMRNNSSAPRDGEADRLIADNVRQQPYSPYFLTQAVIVQEQALQAANQHIENLEQQVQQGAAQPPQGQSGGFLSSIFGGGCRRLTGTRSGAAPAGLEPGQHAGTASGVRPAELPAAGLRPPAGRTPTGRTLGGQQQAASQGGGFLRGALSTAAGVAGGALLFDGIKGLMGGGAGGLGIGQGVHGAGETINNYYGGDSSQTASDYQQDMAQDAADNSGGGTAAELAAGCRPGHGRRPGFGWQRRQLRRVTAARHDRACHRPCRNRRIFSDRLLRSDRYRSPFGGNVALTKARFSWAALHIAGLRPSMEQGR